MEWYYQFITGWISRGDDGKSARMNAYEKMARWLTSIQADGYQIEQEFPYNDNGVDKYEMHVVAWRNTPGEKNII